MSSIIVDDTSQSSTMAQAFSASRLGRVFASKPQTLMSCRPTNFRTANLHLLRDCLSCGCVGGAFAWPNLSAFPLPFRENSTVSSSVNVLCIAITGRKGFCWGEGDGGSWQQRRRISSESVFLSSLELQVTIVKRLWIELKNI